MQFNQKEFGSRLRVLRTGLHITQEELAQSLHVDKQHISCMERGVKAISIDLLIEMSARLHVSTDFLLTGCKKNSNVRAQLETVIAELTDIVHNL